MNKSGSKKRVRRVILRTLFLSLLRELLAGTAAALFFGGIALSGTRSGACRGAL